MDRKGTFLSAVEDALKRSPEEAINILNDQKYQQLVRNSGWELIARLSSQLTEKNRLENFQLYNNTVDLLIEISKVANPEDILFEFIEQAEKQITHHNLAALLKAIKITLLRLPQRRGIAIGWCGNAVSRYLAKVTISQNCRLEEEEQHLLIENDLQFQSLEMLYVEIVNFLQPFVQEIENGSYKLLEKYVDIYKDTVLRTLIKLFGPPLVYIYLGYRKTKGPFRNIAENLMNYVISLKIDVLSILEHVNLNSGENSEGECEYDNTSLGVLYYLILVEGIFVDKISCVYSNWFLVTQLLWLCVSLMKLEDINAQWKGLALAENTLSRIGDKEMIFEKTNRLQCKEFSELCIKIMIYSESKRSREKAVPVFCKFLRMFDARGRYNLVLSVQEMIKEPSFNGYLATRTKDFIAEALASDDHKELKYFTGKCLNDLIKKFCSLDDGLETDLARNSDQIIASLNLLRFLIIRDKDNSTGIFDMLSFLEDSYLKPLKKGLEVSRTHYIFEKREISQPSKSEQAKNFPGITVGGVQLPELSNEQKSEIINCALNTFDLIESLLARVFECIHDRKQIFVVNKE